MNKTFPVSIKVLKKCYGDPTGRRIAEAVLIDKLSSDQTMNGKDEWTNQPRKRREDV